MLARRRVIELFIEQAVTFAMVRQIQLAEGIATADAFAGADARKIDGAMADVMQRVSRAVLGDDFPVGRNDPFLHAADDLDLTVAGIPRTEPDTQRIRGAAQIFLERRRRRIPGRPD